VFFSLGALNHAIAELLADLNRRRFKKLDGCRRDWFEAIDRPALMALPAQPFECALQTVPGQHRLPRRGRRALLQRPA
jgi:hypothetical protein